jgi:3-methyladenine DNA glycosylase AlkD
MLLSEVTEKLQEMGDEANLEKMQRFGIPIENAFGIRMPVLRQFARELGKDHALALQLWDTGKHEAQILASLVDKYREVTSRFNFMLVG